MGSSGSPGLLALVEVLLLIANECQLVLVNKVMLIFVGPLLFAYVGLPAIIVVTRNPP